MANVTEREMEKWEYIGWGVLFNTLMIGIPAFLTWLFVDGMLENTFEEISLSVLSGIAIWGMIRIGNDLLFVKKQQFIVIERMGKFARIQHDGPCFLLLRGLVDKIAKNGADTIAYQELKVYNGSKAVEESASASVVAEIDFTDTSAPVDATCWFCIADPAKKERWDKGERDKWDEINEDIKAWTYAFDSARTSLAEYIDGFARPRLQSMKMDEAQALKDSDPTSVGSQLKDDEQESKGLHAALRDMGVWLHPERPFVLNDIIVSEDIKKARSQRLIADALADADRATGSGVGDGIKNIMKTTELDKHEARAAFETRNSQKVIKDKSGDVQFIASDVGGLTRTLEVSSTESTSKNQDQQRGGDS